MHVIYFSVWDKKTSTYGQLFPAATVGAAERSFHESLKNPEAIAAKYPDDFALYSVLVLDDESGTVVETYAPPRLVVEASSLVG